MDESYRGVDWRRILLGFVVPVAIFQIVCAFTEAVQIIPPLNLVLVPLSFAIVVAFTPNIMRAVEKGRALDTEGMICIGIFIAWGDYVGRGILSLVYRLWPELRWIADTDVNSWLLFLRHLCGCHAHCSAGSRQRSRAVEALGEDRLASRFGSIRWYLADLAPERRTRLEQGARNPNTDPRHLEVSAEAVAGLLIHKDDRCSHNLGFRGCFREIAVKRIAARSSCRRVSRT